MTAAARSTDWVSSGRFEANFLSDATSQTLYFYNRHPISCEIILAKLRASRGHLDGLRPEELFPHDQDHYGGLAATDELARGAQVSNGSRVADFCAGLGGTVRYLAHKYGADVTGIELTPARVSGAQELTRRVGLQSTARIVEGNVMDVPLPDASIDSQPSWQEAEIFTWFDRHGIEFFEGLEIWHVPALRAEFRRRVGRSPRPDRSYMPAWPVRARRFGKRVFHAVKRRIIP